MNSSIISIQLFGDKGKAEPTVLSKNGFDKGVSKLLKFEAKNVGDLQKIQVIIFFW